MVACGGSGDDGTATTASEKPLVPVPEQPQGQLDKAALAKAMDTNCTYENENLRRLGVSGISPDGVAAMYAGIIPPQDQVQELQRKLRPAQAQAQAWRDYLKASLGYIDEQRRLEDRASELAEEGDDIPPTFYDSLTAASEKTYDPADALGLKVCTYTQDVKAPGSGTKPPADIKTEPSKNTVEEAAKDYLAAVATGDCKALTEVEHSDNGEKQEPDCSNVKANFGEAKIVGTETYGPVGVTEINDEEKLLNATLVFVQDTDGVMRHAADRSVPGGAIYPPNPGYDAQESMDAMVAAIRDEDSEAFEEGRGLDSTLEINMDFTAIGTGPTGESILSDIRDSDADPVLLGANQAFAFFLIETPKHSYVLMNTHQPGSETEYAGFSWWPIAG